MYMVMIDTSTLDNNEVVPDEVGEMSSLKPLDDKKKPVQCIPPSQTDSR